MVKLDDEHLSYSAQFHILVKIEEGESLKNAPSSQARSRNSDNSNYEYLFKKRATQPHRMRST